MAFSYVTYDSLPCHINMATAYIIMPSSLTAYIIMPSSLTAERHIYAHRTLKFYDSAYLVTRCQGLYENNFPMHNGLKGMPSYIHR
jgi:hypothetical protein